MIRDFLSSGRALTRRPAMLLPVAFAALLAGCVTTDYRYREDNGGGYYYGTPSVEYRELGPYPYDAYGYYGPYRYAYPGAYGYRHYGYGSYGYTRGYPYRYYVPRYHGAPDGRPRTVDPTPDRPRSPWRDLDEVRRRQRTQLPPPVMPTAPPSTAPSLSPGVPDTGSGLGGRVRRVKERAAGLEGTP